VRKRSNHVTLVVDRMPAELAAGKKKKKPVATETAK
jgi:hypothetical protein